jgi:hypothetical protein
MTVFVNNFDPDLLEFRSLAESKNQSSKICWNNVRTLKLNIEFSICVVVVVLNFKS